MSVPRARIQCLVCMHIIESKSNYDFVTCKCQACSIDGGPGLDGTILYQDYNKIFFMFTDNLEENNKTTEKMRTNYKNRLLEKRSD